MDHPFTVGLSDFAFTALVLSMDNVDLVVFADRDGAGLRWVFGQWGESEAMRRHTLCFDYSSFERVRTLFCDMLKKMLRK